MFDAVCLLSSSLLTSGLNILKVLNNVTRHECCDADGIRTPVEFVSTQTKKRSVYHLINCSVYSLSFPVHPLSVLWLIGSVKSQQS